MRGWVFGGILLLAVAVLGYLAWPTAPDAVPDAPGQPVTAWLAGEEAAAGFPRITGPIPLQFPRDHGAHPQYRHEWWYITGNLETEAGRHFGYQITFFRFNLDPQAPQRASAWGTEQVWMAHLALTDTEGRAFRHWERFSRGGRIGLAGAQVEPYYRVWLDDWVISGPSGGHIMPLALRAAADGVRLVLELDAQKPLVLHGDAGYSQKGPEPGNASRYFSFTRLATRGELYLDGQRHRVRGLSWKDREWGSSVLSEGQVGWDWFALQFDDGTELMYYTLRLADGRIDPRSKGTFVAPDGASQPLRSTDVLLRPLRHWDSPWEDARYPVAWRLEVPALTLALRIEAVLDDQELRGGAFRYWEGAVRVQGSRGEEPLAGRGYVELTGYAD